MKHFQSYEKFYAVNSFSITPYTSEKESEFHHKNNKLRNQGDILKQT